MTKKPAAPQSSPLPWNCESAPLPYSVWDKDGYLVCETNRRKRGLEDSALIVRRVNQGPAFDAMEVRLRRLLLLLGADTEGSDNSVANAHYKIGTTDWAELADELAESRAALKLAQEVR